MVKGLYTAYTGMVNSQYRLDVVSNNLANATTTGFKKEGCTTKAFDEMMGVKINDLTVGHINQKVGTMSLGAKIGETYRNWSQGSMINTENTYDFALSGKGFFSIEFTNKLGETSTMYTRDGAFHMNKEGFLVTKDGDFLLGQTGPIQLPTNLNELTLEPTGEVFADGMYVDTLALVDFEDYNYLEMYGENLYVAVDGATQTESVATVTQGYLEASNINVVQEMVEMITIAREYESGQKVINAIDSMLGRMVNISEL
ncbi:MAG: flagellar hook-basal body protein [Lachnospira sp.]|nr:flagellar hook-basal body protein [Lachnospira sp.]